MNKRIINEHAKILCAVWLLALLVTPPTWSATQRDRLVEIEGMLRVQHEDGPDWSRTLYFLDTGDQQIRLEFGDEAMNLRGGSWVRVRGTRRKDVMVVDNISANT